MEKLAAKDTGKETQRETAWLQRLYDCFAAPLTNGLRRHFGNGPPDPEDMMQQAFQKLIERKDGREIKNIRGFLWRTARNLTLNELRARETRSKYDYELEQLYFTGGWDESTPERVLSMQEQLRQIDAVLRTLPTLQRRCFILHKVEGLSVMNVCERTGLSKTSVYRHIVNTGIEIDLKLQLSERGAP